MRFLFTRTSITSQTFQNISTTSRLLQHRHPTTKPILPRLRPLSKSDPFSTTSSHLQQTQPRPNFYRTHGRAFFKTFTLAFLAYQVIYWYWLTISSEEVMDEKKAQIEELKSEVKLLDGGRRSHGGRLLEEKEEQDSR